MRNPSTVGLERPRLDARSRQRPRLTFCSCQAPYLHDAGWSSLVARFTLITRRLRVLRLLSLGRVRCRALPDDGVERIGEEAARAAVEILDDVGI
jgi:hypothetical protein